MDKSKKGFVKAGLRDAVIVKKNAYTDKPPALQKQEALSKFFSIAGIKA